MCDAQPSGRPIQDATPEIIEKVQDKVLANQRFKVRDTVEDIDISHGYPPDRWSVCSQLTTHAKCVTTTKECLALFIRNPDKLFHRRRNMDLQQHTGDQGTGETVSFSGRIDAQYCQERNSWSARDIIHINNVWKGRKINGEYNNWFNEIYKKKMCGQNKSLSSRHCKDTTRASSLMRNFINLAMNRAIIYHILRKRWFDRTTFDSNDEINPQTNVYLNLDPS